MMASRKAVLPRESMRSRASFSSGMLLVKSLVKIEVEVVVEIDDESFVLGIAGLHESDGGFVHAGTLCRACCRCYR